MNWSPRATRISDCPDFDTHIKRHKSQEGGKEGGLSLSQLSLLCLCEEVETLWGAYSVSRVERRMQNPERQTRHSDPQHSASCGHYLSCFITDIILWSRAPPSSSRIYPNANGLGWVAVAKESQCCHWLSQYLKCKVKTLPQVFSRAAGSLEKLYS